ncbi:MAG: hypothetical protein PHU46_12630 [Rhodocyclaceae bacterium]|nr:hypothetical protein [Rhodocyclaceae bacterium]
MHAPASFSIELHASPRLAAVILLVHALAGAGLALAGLPAWMPVLGGLLLLGSAIHGLRRHALRASPAAVFRLQARSDGSIECLTRDGEWQTWRVLPDTNLFPQFAVLCLRPEGGGRRRHLTLFPDALAAEDWRRLCVWLRWAAAEVPVV